ncbi:MAG: DUF6106 family protein [Christensenellales bacterium]
MDQFHEEVVKRTKEKLYTVLYVLYTGGFGIFGVLAVLLLGALLSGTERTTQMYVAYGVYIVLFGVLAFLCYIGRGRVRTEYEYTFTNGELDFAKVINNRSRKPVGSIHARNIQTLSSCEDGAYAQILKDKPKEVIHEDLSLNPDRPHYYIVFSKDGRPGIITFEPSDTLLGMIYDANPNLRKRGVSR